MVEVASFDDASGALIEKARLPVLLLGPDGVILRRNAAARAVFGGASASFPDLLHDPEGARSQLLRAADSALPLEIALPPAQGEVAPRRLRAYANLAPQGAGLLLLIVPEDDRLTGADEGLLPMLHDMTTATTAEALSGVLCDHLSRLFPGSSGRCYLPQKAQDGTLHPMGGWGRLALAQTVIRQLDCWALRRGGVHEVGFTGQIKPPCRNIETGIPSYICLPLRAQSAVVGIVHLLFETAPASADRAAIAALAAAISVESGPVLGMSAVVQAMLGQPIRDNETGLFSQSFVDEMLPREILRMRRAGRPLTVATVCIDQMPALGEKIGAEARQSVVRAFSQLLLAFRQGSDVASHYDADRFVLVLPDMNAEQARKRLATFQDTVTALQLDENGHQMPEISASLGVAIFPDCGDDAADLLRLSALALEKARNTGSSGQIVISSAC